ncbi:MAG: Integrase core protein, partial [Bradyrhizobium sp.]|nr:Integrase core protein [Bradyrhizobium sp.]
DLFVVPTIGFDLLYAFVIVLGEVHLRQILQSYARYYNNIRTHRSLDKDAPVSRPVRRTGVISSRTILGGLHHHYARV